MAYYPVHLSWFFDLLITGQLQDDAYYAVCCCDIETRVLIRAFDSE